MKRATVLVVFLFTTFMLTTPLPTAAQTCVPGQIMGEAGVTMQQIDCGGGHDCYIPVCNGCFGCCCVEDGGIGECTYCGDYQFCTEVTVGCT